MAVGVLPFDRECEIRDFGSENIQIPESGDSDLPIGVWKVSQGVSSVGATYSYAGIIKPRTPEEMSLVREAIMGHQNRKVSVSPAFGSLGAFKIVEATEHAGLGYFEVALVQAAANG